MPHYIVTPWKYYADLIQVRREIYQLGECAHPVDQRAHAVEWIRMWQMRGSCPHAVESTALLVDATLNHHESDTSVFSKRAAYSAAFCRFVTGFCDISQDSKRKRSMMSVAKELDMPASFVELRHEATHEELPSLHRLSQNAESALRWLWHFYWAKLDHQHHPPTPHPAAPTDTDLERAITSTLSAFLTARKDEIKTSSDDRAAASAALALAKLLTTAQAHDTLVRCLLRERALVPAARTPGDSLVGAHRIWDPLLRRLAIHRRAFARDILLEMTCAVAEPTSLRIELDAYREAMYLWVLHMFLDKTWRKSRAGAAVWQFLDAVVGTCVESPNFFSLKLARSLVDSADPVAKEPWIEVMKHLE